MVAVKFFSASGPTKMNFLELESNHKIKSGSHIRNWNPQNHFFAFQQMQNNFFFNDREIQKNSFFFEPGHFKKSRLNFCKGSRVLFSFTSFHEIS